MAVDTLAPKSEYFWKTRSIPWLLMPWLLVSPDHQQPWYWLHKVKQMFDIHEEGFQLSVPSYCWEVIETAKNIFMFSRNSSAHQGLKSQHLKAPGHQQAQWYLPEILITPFFPWYIGSKLLDTVATEGHGQYCGGYQFWSSQAEIEKYQGNQLFLCLGTRVWVLLSLM